MRSEEVTGTGFAVWACRQIDRFATIILLAAAISTVWGYQLASKLRLDSSLTALLPDDMESVRNLRTVMSKTGGFSTLLVVVSSSDGNAALQYVDKLREKVAALPWVLSSTYEEDTSVFEKHKLLFVTKEDLRTIESRIQERIDYEKSHPRLDFKGRPVNIHIRSADGSADPPPIDISDITETYEVEHPNTRAKSLLFQSDDASVTLLVVYPREGNTDIADRAMVGELERVAKDADPASFHPSMTVEIGGRIKSRILQYDAIIGDVSTSLMWSAGLIILLLVAYHRRWLCIVYFGLPLTISIIWTLAITQSAFGTLNGVTVFLVVVLFGLGIDFGIHNLARYDEARSAGASTHKALRVIFAQTGAASFISGFTTVCSFYTLMIADSPAFYELGFMTGTGVALCYIAMYTIFPALLVVSERLNLHRGIVRGKCIEPSACVS